MFKRAACSLVVGLGATLGVVCLATASDSASGADVAVERGSLVRGGVALDLLAWRFSRCGSTHLWMTSNPDGPADSVGPLLAAIAGSTPWQESGEPQHNQFVARGWPWPAFWHAYEYNRTHTPANNDPSLFRGRPRAIETPGGIRLGSSTIEYGYTGREMPRAIPYRPLWLGLLGDWLAFTVTCFALLTSASMFRRRVRRRGGRCEGCGFDLRGLPLGARCPECGKASWALASNAR